VVVVEVIVFPPPTVGHVVVGQPVGGLGGEVGGRLVGGAVVGGRLVGGVVFGGELGEVEPIIDVVVGAVDAGGTVPSDGVAWQV
jgi:hypothetical protein